MREPSDNFIKESKLFIAINYSVYITHNEVINDIFNNRLMRVIYVMASRLLYRRKGLKG